MSKIQAAPTRHRYRLTLEYAGAGFSGWQKQDDARTIQGAMLAAAVEIFGDERVDIQGTGRTDAGVNALNYTAHLETTGERLPLEIIIERFNELLPANIAVLAISPCHARFHARHSCIGRSYLYQIAKRKSAFNKKYVWWVKDRLDSAAMAETAVIFAGMHDFVSFAERQELKKSTLVRLNGVYLYEDDEMLRLRVVGSHFLWRMVRRMAGVLVEVGRGNLSKSEVAAFLAGPADAPSRLTAPPSGLFFEQAFYDEQEFEDFLVMAAEEAL
ncbi:MAG: tRNA pseudouridine(38-40) synthase TruA [Proteobacteria bacterium]|nr:tRNA pseudouridine(38-40) synthase TruA [Pseudomonadota bacterium]MBU1716065.1 tRNA pseudouridine(38-40) synthase TruA [Pseudomonadota bacterium]